MTNEAMNAGPELKRCHWCHGLGYIRCECWPGVCICGEDERDCEACFGDGWIDPLDDEDFPAPSAPDHTKEG